jgi:hypothetical protein
MRRGERDVYSTPKTRKEISTMAKNDSGLPDWMPNANGNAKSGTPPRRSEAGGALPHWLDSSQAKWSKATVECIDERRKAKAGSSAQGYTPFEGQKLTGRVTATFLRGALAWEDGAVVGPARGRYVARPSGGRRAS